MIIQLPQYCFTNKREYGIAQPIGMIGGGAGIWPTFVLSRAQLEI
jgi:hypothetical protein